MFIQLLEIVHRDFEIELGKKKLYIYSKFVHGIHILYQNWQYLVTLSIKGPIRALISISKVNLA